MFVPSYMETCVAFMMVPICNPSRGPDIHSPFVLFFE